MFLFSVYASPAPINSFQNNQDINAKSDDVYESDNIDNDENELDDLADLKKFLSNKNVADAPRDVKGITALFALVPPAAHLIKWTIDKFGRKKRSSEDFYETRGNENRRYFEVSIYLPSVNGMFESCACNCEVLQIT